MTVEPVLPLNSRTLLGLNQETYYALQQALQSVPPHQIWIAACDDIPLQRQVATALDQSLHPGDRAPRQLMLTATEPNVTQQMIQWLRQYGVVRPAYGQLLGVEQLTHQSSEQQYQFLASLRQFVRLWPQLSCSLLIWLPRPWLRQVQRSVPELWQRCPQVFEFLGDPTPLTWEEAPAPEAALGPTVNTWLTAAPPPPVTHAEPKAETATAGPGDRAPESEAAPATAPATPENVPETPPETTAPADLPADLWQRLTTDLAELELPRQAAADRAVSPVEATAPPADPLALAYQWRDRVEAGDHSLATLAAAIAHYEALCDGEGAIAAAATELLNDLGSLYWLRAQHCGDPNTCQYYLDCGRQRYEAALAQIDAHTASHFLLRLHSNLGGIYLALAAYDAPEQNLGQAVRAFHRALQSVNADQMAATYVSLQSQLGGVYWSLAQQTQTPNYLHRAIAAYQEALAHQPPHLDPQLFTQLQNNLGIAYWSLAQHERAPFLLAQAVEAYRSALAYRTQATDPVGCAATHNHLGTAYWDWGRHQTADPAQQRQSWQQAIAAYEQAVAAALQVQQSDPVALGFDLWATHHSLSVVHSQLAQDAGQPLTTREQHLQAALTQAVHALNGWQHDQPDMVPMALQVMVQALRQQAELSGTEAQQRSLNQIPATWLPEIWRQL